jgi:hypothetical protein
MYWKVTDVGRFLPPWQMSVSHDTGGMVGAVGGGVGGGATGANVWNGGGGAPQIDGKVHMEGGGDGHDALDET